VGCSCPFLGKRAGRRTCGFASFSRKVIEILHDSQWDLFDLRLDRMFSQLSRRCSTASLAKCHDGLQVHDALEHFEKGQKGRLAKVRSNQLG
jgi:hypothetical protein